MKDNKGFIISTTLYSSFGIMMITVATILYVLSNNQATMSSMTDKLKLCIEECNTPENICDEVIDDIYNNTNPCGGGKDNTLNCKILGNNYENVTETVPGLFRNREEFDYIEDDEPYEWSYYYRGEVENNYLTLNGLKTRIVKINYDGSIKVIEEESSWSEVFNSADYRSLDYGRYESGELGQRMMYYYDGSMKRHSKYLAPTVFYGSAPGRGRTLDISMWGILNADEVEMSGEDINKTYLSSGGEFWTLTADITYELRGDNACSGMACGPVLPGAYVALEASGGILYFNGTKLITKKPTTSGKVRVVYNLKPNLIVIDGTGTEDDPYVLE